MLNDRENTSRRLPYEAETSEQFCDYLASVFTNVDHKHANLARDVTRCEDGENVFKYGIPVLVAGPFYQSGFVYSYPWSL